MIKWFGDVFVGIEFSKELYWTDRKQGGRLYHIFNVGIYDMGYIGSGIKCLSITLPFCGFKIGYARS